MNVLADLLHPTFDELSAHADRSDVDAARTRIGRHVVRCASCSGTIAEIRALGDAARARELPGVPPSLWARIEREVATAPVTSLRVTTRADAHGVPAASSTERLSRRRVPFARRGSLALVAAAVVVVMVFLASGSPRDLGAAPPTRLTLDRFFVVPGHGVAVRYRPVPMLAGYDSLTVWASYRADSTPARTNLMAPLVRAGTLRRSSPNEFTGAAPLPIGVRVARYLVGDVTGTFMDRTPAIALAADSAGRPSFATLVTFLVRGAPSRSTDRDVVDAAVAELERHHADRPETPIILGMYGRGNAIARLARDSKLDALARFVAVFEMRERQFNGWHDAFAPRRRLSAETELLMAGIATELEDTVRARYWTARAVREHPGSPAAVSSWITVRRDVPSDSTADILAQYEPIWLAVAGGVDRMTTEHALQLAERSGDTSLVRRWRLRAVAAGDFDQDWLLDRELRSLLRPILRDQLVKAIADTMSGPSLWFDARRTAWMRSIGTQGVATQLAAIRVLDGDVVGARATLDSLAAVAEAHGMCVASSTSRWRAEAALRAGDLATARSELAYLATTQSWRVARVADSVPSLLGKSFDPQQWDAAKREQLERHRRCLASGRLMLQGH